MSEQFRSPESYVSDPELARKYSAYQEKYRDNPRESDKKSARLAMSVLRDMQPLHRAPRILDVGCSTGNFLRHLKRVIPEAELTGGDLMEPTLEQCRNDPTLQGVKFERQDILNVKTAEPFDVIVVNAVTYLFDRDVFMQACRSLHSALRPGGAYIGYELIAPGGSQYDVFEGASDWNPNGFRLILRSETSARHSLREAGFTSVEIEPFEIPIDLPKPDPYISANDANLVTYTVRDPDTGKRLMFRGALYQPWAHIVARAAESP